MAAISGLIREDPRNLQMGLDVSGEGRVTQLMTGPLGVDVDNDGTVDVVITPEMLRAIALQRGTPVSAAGRDAVAGRQVDPPPAPSSQPPPFRDTTWVVPNAYAPSSAPPLALPPIVGPPLAPIILPPIIRQAPPELWVPPPQPDPAPPSPPTPPQTVFQPQHRPVRIVESPPPSEPDAHEEAPRPRPIRRVQTVVERPIHVMEVVHRPVFVDRPLDLPVYSHGYRREPRPIPTDRGWEVHTVQVKYWTPPDFPYHDPTPGQGCDFWGPWVPEQH